jgi:hypothetical protein
MKPKPLMISGLNSAASSELFKLAPDGWRSTHALKFAELLAHSDPQTQSEVRELFGLQIVYRNRQFEVDWDGTKFGFGTFRVNDKTISFVIEAKVGEVIVFEMLSSLDLSGSKSPLMKFGSVDYVPVGRSTDSNFSLAYLIGLFREIVKVDLSLFNIYNSRRLTVSRSVIRGRPRPHSIAVEIAKGSDRMECEVLDNARQRDIASLLVATSDSLQQIIARWMTLAGADPHPIQIAHQRLRRNLAHLALQPISTQLVTRCSRPPYPFGLKRLAEDCTWFWRGTKSFIPDSVGRRGLAEAFVLDMAKAFQHYAGSFFTQNLPSYRKIPTNKLQLQYSTVPPLPNPSGSGKREIDPDHVYFDDQSRHLLILEVKYSQSLATREHLGQIITYLDFCKYSLGEQARTGCLVYPGPKYAERRISDFGSDIRVFEIPINAQGFDAPELAESISIR